jgi:hypothetical protein
VTRLPVRLNEHTAVIEAGIQTTGMEPARVATGQQTASYDVADMVVVLEAVQPEGQIRPGEKKVERRPEDGWQAGRLEGSPRIMVPKPP